MGYVGDRTLIGESGKLDAMTFLEQVGDDEILKFMRRLPMIAGCEGGKFILADFIYEVKLWPFVIEAWKAVPGQPGIAGRLQQIDQVYRLASENLKKLTGEERRFPRVIDIAAFVLIYTTEGLP